MSRQMFINLPVKQLDRSVAFFTALGFTFNPKFTDENGTCMIVSESSFVMLLAEPFFQTFIDRAITDARKAVEVLICLSCESREEADDLVRKAVAAGGTAREPQDYGFMYQHGFEDPDGHLWELAYMSAMPD